MTLISLNIFSRGPAAGKYIKLFNENGIYVIHKCTTIRHGLSAVKMGASCLSIDGFECAGHGGEEELGGLLLLALAAKRLNIPYVASGGIGDGRGMAAALALGAQVRLPVPPRQNRFLSHPTCFHKV
jgi:NAD(P)H-dependent flavin oxidoreductase YrpB (nitropropane dioxygenase family)